MQPRKPPERGAPPGQHVAAPADDSTVGRTCPICQTQVVRGESLVRCPACDLAYHEDCWAENAGCGAYGCERAPETKKPKEGDQIVQWGGEKRCPACEQMIKAQALVCFHCKTRFWTRDPVSAEAWSAREYTGPELTRVRNVMVAIFIASACGCIFPLMGLYTASWIWRGTGPFPYARLPTSLQILLKASFGATVAWGLVSLLVWVLSG